ncbi:N-acetylneuraminate synthase family protein [Paenibacillus thiaminolyticus]|uniref:N-acetylneuraminate synthase n=1 Tax=Paenibacillus thiaminolyticus TaxID=49283 RepID=A0A3A3GK00_PANTH|nr:N-acetylneuraminate synthase family protein [Paenibacillus thiaminolyticus]RJG24823.1 N-acetylneuraminate synthase [Paenibacillus thiaminolyticus]
MKSIKIGDREIGNLCSSLIVAEIGANHNLDMGLIKQTIDAAAVCGVDAVKFQTYTPEELLADVNRIITWGPKGSEVTEPISEMFRKLSLPREWHEEVFAYAKEKGLIAFSTPFSVEGLHFLNDTLDIPCIKIAASDVNYIDLLQNVGKTGKPVMLSLGKCTLSEADMAIEMLFENGAKDLVIMHCVAQYPSPMEEMNLKVIESLKTLYPECVVGFSDHSLGITAAIGAVALGARVIEKHFTLDKSLSGPDHWFSIDPHDMKSLVQEIRNLEAAMGHPRKKILACEKSERDTSVRSLVLAKSIMKGEMIRKDHLKMVRPGTGISPFDVDKVLGLRVTSSLDKNTVLTWEHFK